MGTDAKHIKLSVIVPFYNAEKDLKRCVESLMRQIDDTMELILINDASTDSSMSVLRNVLQQLGNPQNVHILENEFNKGSALSRQAGLEKAQGEFFIYCDADDWIEDDMYRTLLDCAEERNADVVCSPFYYDFENDSKLVGFKTETFPNLNDAPLDTVHFSLCNKIIRRKIVTDHQLQFFPYVNCWEDLGLVSRVLMLTNRVEIVGRPFYHYVKIGNESLSSASMDRVLNDHLMLVPLMEKWIAKENPQFADDYAGFLKFLKFTAKIKLLRGKNRDIRRWKEIFPEANKGILQYRNVPWHYRILFFLVDIPPVGLMDFIFKKIL